MLIASKPRKIEIHRIICTAIFRISEGPAAPFTIGRYLALQYHSSATLEMVKISIMYDQRHELRYQQTMPKLKD